jgi:hypothetical protein
LIMRSLDDCNDHGCPFTANRAPSSVRHGATARAQFEQQCVIRDELVLVLIGYRLDLLNTYLPAGIPSSWALRTISATSRGPALSSMSKIATPRNRLSDEASGSLKDSQKVVIIGSCIFIHHVFIY